MTEQSLGPREGPGLTQLGSYTMRAVGVQGSRGEQKQRSTTKSWSADRHPQSPSQVQVEFPWMLKPSQGHIGISNPQECPQPEGSFTAKENPCHPQRGDRDTEGATSHTGNAPSARQFLKVTASYSIPEKTDKQPYPARRTRHA